MFLSQYSPSPLSRHFLHILLTASQELFPARRFSPETLSLSLYSQSPFPPLHSLLRHPIMTRQTRLQQPLRARKQRQQHQIQITARVSDFLQPLSLQVFRASAAVSPLRQVLRRLSQQQVRTLRHSVKLLSSLPSVNQSPFTALLFQS